MNQEVKEKWVRALRSGEYKQGGGVLRSGDRFCCLGVLCDIVDPEGWAELALTHRQRHRGELVFPRPELRGDVGIGSLAVLCILSDMNDVDCKSFQEIADYIEEEL